MPQRGSEKISLNQSIEADQKFISPGLDALELYVSFSDSGSENYTWSSDETMHYSLDEFYEGDLAMMFNFSWHYETIKSKNSKLNFAVTSIPQLNPDSPVNVSNYWVLVVSKNKLSNQGGGQGSVSVTNETRIAEAWQFVKFLTVKNNGNFGLINPVTKEKLLYPVSIDPAKMYLEETNKPAARRDLIENQKNDPFLGPFVEGNLIAKSWIRKNSEQIELVWSDVINSINKGNITVGQALGIANSRIDALLKD
jgi:ABC-type glycerol-3-phosphate transport system substrate-binding protein